MDKVCSSLIVFDYVTESKNESVSLCGGEMGLVPCR